MHVHQKDYIRSLKKNVCGLEWGLGWGGGEKSPLKFFEKSMNFVSQNLYEPCLLHCVAEVVVNITSLLKVVLSNAF